METIKNEQVYAFDSLYTTNHIQMLKILLPYLNPPLQKNLALYIKFLELRYTISFLNAHPYALSGCGFDKKYGEQEIPLEDLLPYLTPKEAENFRQIQKSMDMMKQFSNIQKNMEALKDILPEGMDFETLFGQMMGAGQPGSDGFGKKPAESGGASEKSDIPDADASDKARRKDTAPSASADSSAGAQSNPSAANNILRNMMKGAPSGDILKNMMSDSQKELYEKFNERFQNL